MGVRVDHVVDGDDEVTGSGRRGLGREGEEKIGVVDLRGSAGGF